MFAATSFEYRFRYFIHGFIYAIGFSSFWDKDWFNVGKHTLWIKTADYLSQHGMGFTAATNAILVIATAFVVAAAWLRMWGSAYIGASIVQSGNMHAPSVVADGPYRYLRNPLYLGTILFTLGLVWLMRPIGAVITVVLIVLYQFRLILREEPYLSETLGPAYLEYCRQVPRIVPRLASRVPHGAATARWVQAIPSEVLFIGTAISFLAFGWTYSAATILRGVLIALGASLIAKAFIPQRSS